MVLNLNEALAKLSCADTDVTSERKEKLILPRKRASVLIPILANGTVLLTLRAKTLRSHGGEVSFPGGKQDPEDANDDVRTALREAQEEVGLKSVRPISCLPAIPSYHGLWVTPVVGIVEDPNALESLVLSKEEVDAVFVVPLEYFADDSNLSRPLESMEWHGMMFQMRTYQYTFGKRLFTIWGLTAYIAHQAASIASFHGEGCLQRYFTPHLLMPPQWQRGYFTIQNDGEFLVQKELSENHEDQTTSESAYLNLTRIQIKVDRCETEGREPAHSFQVQELNSGQLWRLVAANETQRLQWIAFLKLSSTRITRTNV